MSRLGLQLLIMVLYLIYFQILSSNFSPFPGIFLSISYLVIDTFSWKLSCLWLSKSGVSLFYYFSSFCSMSIISYPGIQSQIDICKTKTMILVYQGKCSDKWTSLQQFPDDLPTCFQIYGLMSRYLIFLLQCQFEEIYPHLHSILRASKASRASTFQIKCTIIFDSPQYTPNFIITLVTHFQ